MDKRMRTDKIGDYGCKVESEGSVGASSQVGERKTNWYNRTERARREAITVQVLEEDKPVDVSERDRMRGGT